MNYEQRKLAYMKELSASRPSNLKPIPEEHFEVCAVWHMPIEGYAARKRAVAHREYRTRFRFIRSGTRPPA